MESHHGSNALYLATTRLRLLMLLNADDSHLSLLQQRMVTQRLHELGNSVMNGCPVPEPTATVQVRELQIPGARTHTRTDTHTCAVHMYGQAGHPHALTRALARMCFGTLQSSEKGQRERGHQCG